jgi:hypothetical protein
MVGDIAAPRVIIVDGASFRGRIDMGEVDVEQGRTPAPARHAAPAPAPARPSLRPSAPPARTAAAPAPKREEKVAVAAGAPVSAKPPAPPAPVAMGAVKRKVIVKRK